MRKIILIFFSCFAFLGPHALFASTIRSIQENENQIAVIHTALGYSTLLEFPSKPSSAILGDQDAFQLEYLGNTLTIKPLIANATSNLFIFTQDLHYNCTLMSGSKSQVDYVVRFTEKETPSEAKPSERRPIALNRSSSFGGVTLTALSILPSDNRADPRGATIIQFELKSARAYSFSPSSIGLRQSGKPITAQGLYLDRVQLDPGAPPVAGTLVVLNQDRSSGSPLELDFEVETPSRSRKTKKKITHRISVSLAIPRFTKGVPHGPFQATENQDHLLFPGGPDTVLEKARLQGQKHQAGGDSARGTLDSHSPGGGK